MKRLRVVAAILLIGVLLLSMLPSCSGKNFSSASSCSDMEISSPMSCSDTEISSTTNRDSQVSSATTSTVTATSSLVSSPLVSDEKNLSATPLDMSEAAVRKVPGRSSAGNTRMLVNTDNPLFVFHPKITSVYVTGEELVRFWEFLPTDIRAYSALFINYNPDKSNAEVIDYLDELLATSDAHNIPVIVQVENWDSYRERQAFTVQELSGLLNRHKSLKGYAHVELSCMYSDEEECNRLKTTIRACQENQAIFMWLDMEYVQNTNVFARFLENQELYNLMSGYAQNVILVDKHNGQGRHFATQSAAMGGWLSGVCGNWGSNVESWLWWEEGLGLYDDMGGTFRSKPDTYIKEYPAAMAGMDTLCDTVGGATVYSFEDLTMTAVNADGELVFTPAFYNVLYPIYQKIVADKIIPTKAEVQSKIKVAYQYSNINAEDTAGYESPLLVDLYGPTTSYMNTYHQLRVSKKWLPTTGRYYIIPSLLKQVKASTILPNAKVINSGNYTQLLGSGIASKQQYFNSQYEQTYTGSATMYDMGKYAYIFNNNENITIDSYEDATFSLKKSGSSMTAVLPEHTYALLYDTTNSVRLELYNYRYDARNYFSQKERWDMFMDDYLDRLKESNPADFRNTTFMVKGLSHQPEVTIFGSNNAKAVNRWDSTKGTLTVQVTSNGVVYVELKNM